MRTSKWLFSLLALILLLSACSPKEIYRMPDPFPGTEETEMPSVFATFINRLGYGATRECTSYVFPEDTPDIQDVLDYYQGVMEDQGWQGEPSELLEQEFKLNATWKDEARDAGMTVIYMKDMWQSIVCIGNP